MRSSSERYNRRGRSLLDLIGRPQDLHAVGVGFVSLTEAFDIITTQNLSLALVLVASDQSPGSPAAAGITCRHINRSRLTGFLINAERTTDTDPHGRISGVRA
jgi:hypothetical protein